jgi:hypothetical protein
VALRRIDPDPEFRFAAKIEVLRRRIVFVKSGLRIEPFWSLYHLIPIKTVENLSQTGPQREHLTYAGRLGVWTYSNSTCGHRQPIYRLAQSIPAAGVGRATGDTGIAQQGDSLGLDIVISDHVTCKNGTCNYTSLAVPVTAHPIVSYQLFQPKLGGAHKHNNTYTV